MSLRQFLVELGDRVYYQKLTSELRDCQLVLDLGCGSESPLKKVKKHFFSEGFDLYKPSIAKSRKAKIHDKYKVGDVKKIDSFYSPKSFDAVLALDLIEHLKKEEGLKLLKEMERIARKKVVFLTPNGFIKQIPYEKNPYQVHHSGWRVKELRNRGYRVYGMRGLKFIRGEYATIKFKPWLIWGIIATVSEVLVYFWPELAFQVLACKDLEKK